MSNQLFIIGWLCSPILGYVIGENTKTRLFWTVTFFVVGGMILYYHSGGAP